LLLLLFLRFKRPCSHFFFFVFLFFFLLLNLPKLAAPLVLLLVAFPSLSVFRLTTIAFYLFIFHQKSPPISIAHGSAGASGDSDSDSDASGSDDPNAPVAASRQQAVEHCAQGLTGRIDLRGEDRWAEGNDRRKLTEVPAAVFDDAVGHVRTLLLGGNKLAAVSPRLAELAGSLVRLDLSDNGLTEFPAAVCELTGLRTLELYKNKIKTVPDAIAKLTALRSLNLFNNNIMKLNNAVSSLTELRELNVSSNRLITLPSLKSLTKSVVRGGSGMLFAVGVLFLLCSLL
jgi:Leucine-rich repeat (LRR) protein